MSAVPPIHQLSDYPAIKKLASALHRLDAKHHGAAIMIGAGFSRSAAHHVDGQKKMPLWYQFTKTLAHDLYPGEQNLNFADPLRVAEEYRAYFGQAALNDRIRDEINNQAWRAGPMYQLLLELPWTEVLTTNWDTLLEQAAQKIHSPYYTSVTKTSDLASAQSPRIIKLHGTIGVTNTFIAAQEDYRTYPEKFAPFVNLARQIFIENELCLLGFSGDDPNFLQWAGWVRDHLANNARKIYLIGALNLSSARRKHLESINISPIDLWPAVAHISDSDLRHKMAIEMFLQTMEDEGKSLIKPQDWLPTRLPDDDVTLEQRTKMLSDPVHGAAQLTRQLDILKRDRESYPGWLVCPPSLRWHLSGQINSPFPNQHNLRALPPDKRAALLYEIAWRHSVAFEYIAPWLFDALIEVAEQDQPCALSKRQQLEIAVILLNNTRWLQTDDKDGQSAIEEYVGTLIGILEKDHEYLPDCTAEIVYYQSLVARDQFDYKTLSNIVERISGEDSIWNLRKAALLAELGRTEEAYDLITKTYGELRENHRRDRHSIPILSRLTWAHWLLDVFKRGNLNSQGEELPPFAESNYRKWKCDPWLWIDDLRYTIDKRQENHGEHVRQIEPQFDQGRYRDHSNRTGHTNDASDFLLLDSLSRTVGIPFILGGSIGVNLLGHTAEKIVLYGGTSVELWDHTLAIRSASNESSKAIKGLFTRIGVACASQEAVDTTILNLRSAISYWRQEMLQGSKGRDLYALSKLRVFLEVLARLAVRIVPSQAKEFFLLGTALGAQPKMQDVWLAEVIEDLLNRTLKSIPEADQGDLLPNALAFPLNSEIMGVNFPHWPNPVISHINPRNTYSSIDERISQLIENVASTNGDARRWSLLRLLPLCAEEGFLTKTEYERLAAAIWGEHPDYESLPEIGLYPHALLLLPVLDAQKSEALVRAILYDHGSDVLENTQRELRTLPSPEIQRAAFIYHGIANAAESDINPIFPTPQQALFLFDRLIKWRPPIVENDPFLSEGNIRKHLAESIGLALSYSIVPALAEEAMSTSRLAQLIDFYVEVEGAQSSLPAFIHFSHMDEDSANTIVKIYQVALRSHDPTKVAYSAIALRKWIKLQEPNLPDKFRILVSTVIAIIESGRTIGMHQLLWLAGDLLTAGRLSDEQHKTLVEITPTIFASTAYSDINPNGPEAVTASTIRAECVRLALLLQQQNLDDTELKNLVARSHHDPLPEVRFAAVRA